MATGDNAMLTRASVSFHTNGEDKDGDTQVEVTVRLIDQTVVASIADAFGPFDDNSDAGPFRSADHAGGDPRGAEDRQRRRQNSPGRPRHVALQLLPGPLLRRRRAPDRVGQRARGQQVASGAVVRDRVTRRAKRCTDFGIDPAGNEYPST